MEFNKKALNRKLIKIATPIAIQGIVSATLSMVDNIMVGFLGETELAAVGVGSQLFMVHYLVLFGILSGSATFMAQFYGTKDMGNIRKVIGFDFTLLAVLGAVLFILVNCFTDSILSVYTEDPAVKALAAQYVRINSLSFLLLAVSSPLEMAFKATQQVRIPMLISNVIFFTNIAINYVLIFGKLGFPKMGVAGAAIGTISSRIIEVIMNSLFAFRTRNEFCGKVRSYFGWDRELVKRIIKNATPTTINEFFWSFGQTMYVAAFSRISTTAYAAYQAANSIFNIFNFAAFSIGDAALILIGEKLGEGDMDYTWKLSKHLIKASLLAGLIIGTITILLSQPLSGIFKLTDMGKMYTRYILIVFGATMAADLFNGLQIAGILRAGGDTKFAMISESACIWLVAVPLAFTASLVWHLPVHLALLVTRTEMIIRGTILAKRYLSKKWMNTVITDL
ncbi:MAG: MATE family efflux transporter [Mogibacterium sp.]|nr:MATE family efflux transporter [Mogibacterium sp.]MBQ6501107.1 MATE family efflux transporter [Mogibacterium sp.]